jgi:hypothetical protein
MNPLMIVCCVGELVDAFLRDLKPIRDGDLPPSESLELV